MDSYTLTEQAYKNGYEAGKPKWISVEERLPEIGERVLACYINPLRKDRPPRMMVGMNPQYSNNKIYLWCGGWRAITHWMPLPEPPEVKA